MYTDPKARAIREENSFTGTEYGNRRSTAYELN